MVFGGGGRVGVLGFFLLVLFALPLGVSCMRLKSFSLASFPFIPFEVPVYFVVVVVALFVVGFFFIFVFLVPATGRTFFFMSYGHCKRELWWQRAIIWYCALWLPDPTTPLLLGPSM